jgi:hypothetical protein
MRADLQESPVSTRVEGGSVTLPRRFSQLRLSALGLLCAVLLLAGSAESQVSVLTEHNDSMRTGRNLQETTLTTGNVNPTQFGLLFSHAIKGETFAQPLYVPNVTMANNLGKHNVVYVATYNDMVYAFDADSNGGIDAAPLWSVNLLTSGTPSGATYSNNTGVEGTPVIDPSTNTIYLVSSESQNGTDLYRLHALNITSGAEKFGGPVQITATVPGTGTGSSSGSLTFNPLYQWQRPGLLLQNGVVYIAYGSVNDNGPWHGWLFSYSAGTLKQLSAFCTSPSGSAGGIWMGGAGVAGEVVDAVNKPYGRLFLTTGNGTYSIGSPTVTGQPYSNPANQYGMSVLDLDLTNGVPTVEDVFTPYNESRLDEQDGDLGSGGPMLLPTTTLSSGKTLNPLVQIGKSGMIYILDRDNNNDGSNNTATAYSPAGLGGFNAGGDQVVQELQTPISGVQGWGAGVWGAEAYWYGNLYVGGTNPGASNALAAYSIVDGALSTAPTSTSSEQFGYPAPTPSVSSNGSANGIVWVLDSSAYIGGGPEVVYAYDARNLANLLYSSNANVSRDSPGPATRSAIPTIANGKVYVPASSQFSVYGLLGNELTTPAPVIGPTSGTFSGSQTITICFNAACTPVSGGTIYYTLDGSIPTGSSSVYKGPFSISSSLTVTAIASVTGQLQSTTASVIYSSTSNAANPVFSPAPGTYSGPQTLSLTSATSGATIYFTIDGTTPTASSLQYTGPIYVGASETVNAIATAPNLSPSAVVSGAYTITPVYTFNFSNGFTTAQSSGLMTFNGSTDLDDFRLQLTNGGNNEAGSAFYTTPVNVNAFTTDFTFQLSNPVADGITFTIQGVGPTALGSNGGGLGFATIQNSMAIKFDLFSNDGEGPNSTGLYTRGNWPTMPAIDLSSTPIDLHSGNYIDAHITYDGTTLTMTLTNPISLASWSYSWTVNIPSLVGGNSAWVGFTGGTGLTTSSQKITSWTYVAGTPALPNYPVGFDIGMMTGAGAWINGTSLQLTSGGMNEVNGSFYYLPVDTETFTSTFDFTVNAAGANALGDGFAFVIQNSSPTARGSAGAGLGYAGIPNSVAIGFDIFNQAGEAGTSTGVYVNGIVPTQSNPSTSAGIVFNTGDRINVQVTYDGTTLTWRLEDKSSPDPEVYQGKQAINIASIVGSNTAYMGFTASSVNGVAVQDILDWTCSNNP